jgi:UDP-N-acetylglucosamine diphosphorylase / glucose-1-phosphate thymidylyltransferase / UDP-N-acetylgalactosamine diphosphorylase / glucosamine-1-phosphate N-acetyltransferase / galactosamine-1-phosphate N-acetyltransferase
MNIVCFEDTFVARLNPATLARPAYAVTCASLRLIDWLRLLKGNLSGGVRPYLQLIQSLDFELSGPPENVLAAKEDILLVNARLVPRVGLLQTLEKLAQSPDSAAILDAEDESVLAAKISRADQARLVAERGLENRSKATNPEFWSQLASELPHSTLTLSAFHWPHEIVAWHMKELNRSIEFRLSQAKFREIHPNVFVGEGVSIGDYASINTQDGPILLEDNVRVGPFCYLAGPVYAGHSTRVIEHSALKDGVSLGHTVKIGGEVEASVIEPYTNKQHHGFLGHSYLGSWINLGAGTCNSDLKNTYGKINVEYGEHRVATGMQFFGCVMGDYSKSAINTGIFTGKVIGVCSMMYGFVTANVPSFVNYARLFGQTSTLPADIMINTQQRMFARRKVEQRECDRQLIKDMFDLTVDERELAEQIGL